MAEFRMPALGAGMDVGRVLEWYVQPGDEVKRGQIVALVETDKANIEVEVFEDGVVEELLVEVGAKVPVGTPLAMITATTEAVPAEVPEAEPEPAPAATAKPEIPAEEPGQPPEPVPAGATPAARPPAEPVPAPAGNGRRRVHSPLVRRLARRCGVDLSRVRGTGQGGVVTRADVEAAATSPAPAAAAPPTDVVVASAGLRASPYARRLAAERGHDPRGLRGSGPEGVLVARDVPAGTSQVVADAPAPPSERPVPAEPGRPPAGPVPGAGEDRGLAMRLAIARAMEQANREIPHYYLGETVDVDATLTWLSEVNENRPPASRILPAALVLKAVALALRDYPDFNGYWIDDAFRAGPGIHLGVAINLRRGGLLAPAMRNVDERSLDEVMEALKDLVERTRSGGLRGSELTDPTITVSNLGDTGVESILGVITPPQVALVGVGRVTERPWAVDGLLAVRRTLYLSLAADHRASDGHRGGRFLAAVATHLTRPEML